jgi:thiamine-monophosphate kinase
MKIRDIGGEFALIGRITRPGGAVVGVGDDAAVIRPRRNRLLLFTTDMLCDGDHFRREWSTPEQIGMKCMEANVSDIAAMGGLPTHAVVSISLTPDVTVEFMERLYEGMYAVADRRGFRVVGGDTTHADAMAISVAMLGEVEKEMLCLRSDAEVGDLICVTGDLGKSAAGLALLKAGLEGDVAAHLEPRCRLKEGRRIARHANAMIDVSDGLASEVNHICEMSGVGAVVWKRDIPISDATRASAARCGKDPYDLALSGGEDFELVFTVPKRRLRRIRAGCPVTAVGEVVGKSEGTILEDGASRVPLRGGYDHFAD